MEKSHKKLRVWHEAMELAKVVYKITFELPANEKYGLVLQMRKAAISIPSNIAEGFMRRHNKEYKQFLYIALGSLAELETQIILSEQLQFLKNVQSNSILNDVEELNKMITGLIKCL